MKRKILKLVFLSLVIIYTFSCKKEATEPSGVTISPTVLSLDVGSTATIVATVSPSDAADQAVIWRSTNPSIATVSSSGVVTGLKVGSVNIIATTAVGYKEANCALTVTPVIIPLTGVTISPTILSLKIGDTSTILATVSPLNATDQTVNWNSDNPAIATVSSSGVVTAVASGNAKITVSTTDGNKTASCTVTVLNAVAINLIVNPGFEDIANLATTWTEIWSPSKLNTSAVKTGTACLEFEAAPEGGGRAQKINSGFTIGATYKFTVWAKYSLGTGNLFPGVTCFTAEGKRNGDFNINIDISSPENADKWVQYSREFAITEGTDYIVPYVFVSMDKNVLFDDFSLTLK